ncbi:SMP-30/gluconolactonase/LRE family protein [Streptomyces physcomitrii]|uniref:SMP-30/gluconolactonase/LRE family protein n=1 Tax=Streptomyces physcomitrii TaxID=2724184 RepID=UPI00099BC410
MRPRKWKPPAAPERARQLVSTPPLPPVHRLALPAAGPEDVVLDAEGRILTGVADGRLLRVDPDTGEVATLARTGGRPLGLEFCPDGTLLVCDSRRGLLRVTPAGAGESGDAGQAETGDADTGQAATGDAGAGLGSVEVLVGQVEGEPLTFASNVVLDPADGTVYFTASSRRFDLEHYLGDLIEHSGTGRLLRRRPDGRVDTLLDGLHFANGLVLAPDRSFLVLAETGGYCLTRYWLTGPKAGTREELLGNLPGFPDNLALGSDGLIWVALATPRNPLLDRLLPLPGLLRRLVWALPQWASPGPARTTWVLAVSLDGSLVHDLQAEGGSYAMVTSVREREGRLYLGSLHESALATTYVP